MDDEGRRLRAQVAALTRAAQTDGAEISAPAREQFLQNFLTEHTCRLCGTITIPPHLTPAQRNRAAAAAKRVHFKRLNLQSRAARLALEQLQELTARLDAELAAELGDNADAG